LGDAIVACKPLAAAGSRDKHLPSAAAAAFCRSATLPESQHCQAANRQRCSSKLLSFLGLIVLINSGSRAARLWTDSCCARGADGLGARLSHHRIQEMKSLWRPRVKLRTDSEELCLFTGRSPPVPQRCFMLCRRPAPSPAVTRGQS